MKTWESRTNTFSILDSRLLSHVCQGEGKVGKDQVGLANDHVGRGQELENTRCICIIVLILDSEAGKSIPFQIGQFKIYWMPILDCKSFISLNSWKVW